MFRQIPTISRTTLCGIIALVCLATFTTTPVASGDEWQEPTRYAAIAVHDTTGACGYSYNYDTREEAERAAIRRAGGGSRVVLSTTKPFFAFAQAPLGGWGAAAAHSPEEAKSQALCNARKHSICPSIKFCQYNGEEM